MKMILILVNLKPLIPNKKKMIMKNYNRKNNKNYFCNYLHNCLLKMKLNNKMNYYYKNKKFINHPHKMIKMVFFFFNIYLLLKIFLISILKFIN